MKKNIPNQKKLSFTRETVRDLRNVDGAQLKGVAGGDSITGSCQQDGCNNHSGGGHVKI